MQTPAPAGRRFNRRTIFRSIAIGVISLAAILILMAGYVYYQAVKTFEVRRGVSLPTRIFTDMTPLKAGVMISPDDLREKLERLGYREAQTVQKPGDFIFDEGGLLVHLRGFRHPTGPREAQAVRIALEKNQIVSVAAQNGRDASNAALEPELLTSILSDQLENRSPVTLQQVPQHLQDAVVVTEDLRFWQHPGVDPIGIFRALFRNVKAGGVAEGGSTLTQQLVKNYYLTNERTMRRKIVEAFMSVILDAKYSKREIMEAYLNDIYLGRNRSISIVGVGEASRFFFGKPVMEIDHAEAALLAGMIRSPNNYSPFTHAEAAKKRRDTVLGVMLRQKKITQHEYDRAMKKALPKKPFRARSGLSSIPFYVDRVVQELRTDYGIDDAKGRGLSIYTAIDLQWQDEAASSLENGIRGLEKSSRRIRNSESKLEGSIIAVDVRSGEIRALVGGRNYDRSQFNRALNAKRQVGSLYKPFVFLAAFEPSLSQVNITPATIVNDARFVYKQRWSKDWSPRNYGDQYYGPVTVRRALEQSMNAASVRIGLASGIEASIKVARALGIQTEMDDVPSLLLGAVEVPPIEMAEAYTTLARVGSRMPLRAVRFVLDDDGNVVRTAEKFEPVQTVPARDAYLTVHVMEGVLDRGTAAAAKNFGFKKNAAGKTGTTNDKRDAWFIGFTPSTLALTWIGFDDNKPVGLSGSEGAVPIWARYMRDITGREPDRDFGVPSGIVFAPIDITSGGLATTNCPRNALVNEAFKAGTEPNAPCRTHMPQINLPPEYLPPIDPTMTSIDTTMTNITPIDPYGTDPGRSLPPLTTSPSPQPTPSLPPRAPLPDPTAPGDEELPPTTTLSEPPLVQTSTDTSTEDD
jgi:penicillin-binding protein 1B